MHIDPWTIGLQAVNFLLLAWLLQHFLYRPVTKVLRARRAETERLIAAAEERSAEAESLKVALDVRMRAIETERAAILEEARVEAAAAAAHERAMAQVQADGLVAAARRQIDEERLAAEIALQATARELALTVARRLLCEIAPALTLDPFIDAACDEIRRFVANSNVALLLPAETVEVFTSEALPAGAVELLQTRLGELIGRPVLCSCHVKPELAAGIEFVFPRVVIRRCWGDDLAQVSGEIEHGDDARRDPRAMAR